MGTPEIQQVATSINLNTNEVQTITTTVEDVNEVQVITTSAVPQSEVQAITVSPVPGDTTVNLFHSFSLMLDSTSSGGSIQYSGEISATANSDGSQTSVREILGSMSNIAESPTVLKSSMNPDGGYTYIITFPISMKNVPELEVYMSDVPISITTIDNGNVLAGFFKVMYKGDLSKSIPFDASASKMQFFLEELDSIGTVEVSRSDADDQNGFSWNIEFTSNANGGNLDDITILSKNLTTTSKIGGAAAKIDYGGNDGSYIQGTFQLEFRERNIFSNNDLFSNIILHSSLLHI